MSNYEKFWLIFWCGVAATVSIIVGMALVYNYHKNAAYAEMIKAGADPIKIKCAGIINMDNRDFDLCRAAVTQTQK